MRVLCSLNSFTQHIFMECLLRHWKQYWIMRSPWLSPFLVDSKHWGAVKALSPKPGTNGFPCLYPCSLQFFLHTVVIPAEHCPLASTFSGKPSHHCSLPYQWLDKFFLLIIPVACTSHSMIMAYLPARLPH